MSVADIDQIRCLMKEDVKLSRDSKMYDEDCKKDSSQTGVVETSVFNLVKGYHCLKNLVVDLLYDIYEGVANYLMTKLLDDLIYRQGLFTLNYLNDRAKLVSNKAIGATRIPEINVKFDD